MDPDPVSHLEEVHMAKQRKRTPLSLLQQITAAERKAYTHDADLKADGVRTSSLLPRRPSDLTDERQARTYLRKLEKFNRSDYVPGYEGRPLNADLVRRYEAVAKQWNTVFRPGQMRAFNRPLVVGGYPSDDTVHEYNMREKWYHDRMSQDIEVDVSTMRGNSSVAQRINNMLGDLRGTRTKPYLDRMDEVLRETAAAINDPTVLEALDGMTDSQKYFLLRYTDFNDIYQQWYHMMKMRMRGVDVDSEEEQNVTTPLLNNIRYVRGGDYEDGDGPRGEAIISDPVHVQGPSILGDDDPFAPSNMSTPAIRAAQSLQQRAKQRLEVIKRKYYRKRGRRR